MQMTGTTIEEAQHSQEHRPVAQCGDALRRACNDHGYDVVIANANFPAETLSGKPGRRRQARMLRRFFQSFRSTMSWRILPWRFR
jgi:hypothetical protein